MSKYGVISGPYFPVFSSNTGKKVPVTTPYLDTFHAVIIDLLKTNPIRKEYNTIETLTNATANPIRKKYNTIETLTNATTRKLKIYTFFL